MFRPSPLARAGIQLVLILVAVPLALRSLALAEHGYGVLGAFALVTAALLAPVYLDLWAVVRADRDGITWRNRGRTHRLAWSEVGGFGRGPTSMVLHRTDGRDVALRALGLRYFGSKRMAAERLAVLDHLRTGR